MPERDALTYGRRMLPIAFVFIGGLGTCQAALSTENASFADHTKHRKEQPALLLQLGHSAQVTQMAFAPNGRLVTAGADGTIRKWRLSDKRVELVLPPNDGGFEGIGFSQNGDRAATRGADGEWRLLGSQLG